MPAVESDLEIAATIYIAGLARQSPFPPPCEGAHEFDLPLQSSDCRNFNNVGRLCVRGLWQRNVCVFEYRRLRHEGAH